MSPNEIKQAVERLEKEMEEVLDPSTFVLSARAIEIQEEITKIQNECVHKYKDGECIYCKKEK